MTMTTTQTTTFTQDTANLIVGFEGFEPWVYIDTKGVPTVGYGYALVYRDGDTWVTADTPILMADGTHKRIADIAANDDVMSFAGLGGLRKGRVKRTFAFVGREVAELKGLRCPFAQFDEVA